MTENDKKRLMEATARETAEFEKMAAILSKKHDAISRLDAVLVQSVVSEELAELNKIRVVERERAELLKEMMLTGEDLAASAILEEKLGKEDSLAYTRLHLNFQKVFTRVLQLNNMSRVLLLRSLAFIRQNIRILTNDGARKLVDKKA